MKKELNLTKLNKMNEKELKNIKGGSTCGCSCYYAGTPGGSSSDANLYANVAGGYHSPKGLNRLYYSIVV